MHESAILSIMILFRRLACIAMIRALMTPAMPEEPMSDILKTAEPQFIDRCKPEALSRQAAATGYPAFLRRRFVPGKDGKGGCQSLR
jgi:hypothetical protein